jgi:hypothetical protein
MVYTRAVGCVSKGVIINWLCAAAALVDVHWGCGGVTCWRCRISVDSIKMIG